MLLTHYFIKYFSSQKFHTVSIYLSNQMEFNLDFVSLRMSTPMLCGFISYDSYQINSIVASVQLPVNRIKFYHKNMNINMFTRISVQTSAFTNAKPNRTVIYRCNNCKVRVKLNEEVLLPMPVLDNFLIHSECKLNIVGSGRLNFI